MFRSFRKWRADREQRKAAKYGDEIQHMDRAELERLREQQSPLGSKSAEDYY